MLLIFTFPLVRCLLSIWADGHTKFVGPFYIFCKRFIILGDPNAIICCGVNGQEDYSTVGYLCKDTHIQNGKVLTKWLLIPNGRVGDDLGET